MASQVLEADLTWLDGRWQTGIRIQIESGRIEAVGDLPDPPTLRLADRAILPGMINAHSHAFQRGLRGRGETFPSGAGDFWTWRDAMYQLVEQMDAEQLGRLCRAAFTEMLAAGITTVGEFHYLHHDASEVGFAFDEVVLAAAAEVGIRLVLLNAYYRTGGFDQPLVGGQRRFGVPSLEAYWAQMDRLAACIDPATQRLGAVAHSIRAAPIDEIQSLHEESCRRHLVFHMHVEEQPREIEDCLDAHGKTPMNLLNQRVQVNPAFTAVHMTHSAEADLEEFLAAGGNVCICPLTEANLGDGLANVPRMLRHDGRLCLGTDSNARIAFTEEMRWLEYGQRLHHQTRGVCRCRDGRQGPTLWAAASVNGARSLGLKAGQIRPGFHADLIAIDLTSPPLLGIEPDHLLEGWILGTGNEAIAEVCVAGNWIRARPA